jgi:thiosulfate dehydrogenase [quinone] large subunit
VGQTGAVSEDPAGTAARTAAPLHRRTWHLGPPPASRRTAGWVLLPLRGFLGFTFCFAGLQKLANPTFFNSANPSGIHAQLLGAARVSPLHALLGHLVHLSTPIGVLIALGELAVGLGTLLGLLTPIAAIGGLLLSITLFLSVSYHSSPYYTGADIVFVFAWLPLIVAGSGGVLSLDAFLEAKERVRRGLGPASPVTVPFAVIQQVCGHYAADRCNAQRGAACAPRGCPFLAGIEHPASEPVAGAVRRRPVLLGTLAAGVGALGLAGAGAAAGLGRLIGGAKVSSGLSALGSSTAPQSSATTTTTSTSTTLAEPASTTTPSSSATTTSVPEPTGTIIGRASGVPLGGAATFTVPESGDPGIVLQPSAGHFVAFDAVCPHQGCTVGFSSAAELLVCPCHGSEFNATTGALVRGPAPHGLRAVSIAEGHNGDLYAQ